MKTFRLPLQLCVGLIVAATAGAAEPTPTAPATPSDLVDAFNTLFGRQTYGRAIHAKGIVLRGSFVPDPSARNISKAVHLRSGSIPVLVRFSSFAGIPTIRDTDGLATPRGMAVKFQLPDGTETDIVTHSFNGFPTETADQFHDLIVALAASGPGVAAPTPADRFMDAHPAARAFFANLPGPPVSFATLAYYGVNSFALTNARAEVRYGRYRLVPLAGTLLLSKEQAASASPNYLEDEIGRRLAAGPIEFSFQVQIARPGDRIADPSVAWSESHETVKLGVIRIEKLAENSDSLERTLLFTPAAVVDGIAPADPMITARSAAYSVSYARRHQ